MAEGGFKHFRTTDAADSDAWRKLRHDLRTPINHIIGYAELLIDEAEDLNDAPRAADLRRILAAGRTLLEIVDDLLDPGRLGGGDVDLDVLSHRLRTPLNVIVGYAELLQEEPAGDAANDYASDLQKIRGAALHLLGQVDALLDLSLFRASDAGDRPPAARAGEGGPAAAGVQDASESRRRPGQATGRVLVVDDNLMNRDMLSRRLDRLGYAVTTAEDGSRALDLIRSRPFDLVLLDMMMPGLTGFDVLQQLRADKILGDLPVIVLSALDEIDEAARCIELGADDYLTKPFNTVLLLARIESSLERKRLRDREIEYLERVAQVTGPAQIARLLHQRAGIVRTGPDLPAIEAGPATVAAIEAAQMPPAGFSEEEMALLRDIDAEVEWVAVGKGEVLVRQGAPSDSVYIVVYGRLQAWQEEADGRSRAIGEIQNGETIGEWGLLSGQPRSATVVAVRDSRLARLPRDGFERLARKHPRILTHATRDVVGRLRQAFQARWLGPAVTAFALVPISPGVPLDDLTQALARELAAHGPTLLLDRSRLDSLFGESVAGELDRPEAEAHRLVARLNDVEPRHRFVVYQADAEPTPWTRRCLRQADRVILVARDGAAPAPGLIEAALDRVDGGASQSPRELVILHDRRADLAAGTRDWLAPRAVTAHHHLALSAPGDVQRLARRLSGQAIGLVLGGGGLRSAAHIGVIQALREAGIPVDAVGGTSAGALMAAMDALDWPPEVIHGHARRLFVELNVLGDYTLPIVSIIAGRRFTSAMHDLFGEVQIEDLWRPFFCVSSNLTRGEQVIHRDGPLWRAVRASCSIPGVMPPILQDGDLLVDGALLNNLPADVMTEVCDGGHVIAVDLRVKVDLAGDYAFGDSVSALDLLRGRLSPFAKDKLRVPGLMSLLSRSTVLGSIQASESQLRHATHYLNPPVGHFGLLDRKNGDAMYEIGHEYARGVIAGWRRDGLFQTVADLRGVTAPARLPVVDSTG